jgi:hypothetical protein
MAVCGQINSSSARSGGTKNCEWAELFGRRNLPHTELGVLSYSVMAYDRRDHRGKLYGPISSRQRQDHARHSSKVTAIESSDGGARALVRHQ